MCWFLPYNTNQPLEYIRPPPSWTSLPLHALFPPLWVITEPQVELPALYRKVLQGICFTHGNVYVSLLLSQFAPPSPSSTGSASLFSVSVSPLLPCKWVHQHHFFWIPYMCVNIQYWFFSFWFTSLYITGSRFSPLPKTDSNSFLLGNSAISYGLSLCPKLREVTCIALGHTAREWPGVTVLELIRIFMGPS